MGALFIRLPFPLTAGVLRAQAKTARSSSGIRGDDNFGFSILTGNVFVPLPFREAASLQARAMTVP